MVYLMAFDSVREVGWVAEVDRCEGAAGLAKIECAEGVGEVCG